jgi:hypothetical protein
MILYVGLEKAITSPAKWRFCTLQILGIREGKYKMGTHRYIATSFWDDEWVQTLDPSEKLLYLYLMTNPLTNIAGIYKITEKRISFDSGFNIDTLRGIFEKFERAGKAYRMGEYVILPSWPKHQNWENKEDIYAGIVKILNSLSDKELVFISWIRYKFPIDDILTQRGVEPPPTPHKPTYSILSNLNLSESNINSSGSAESEPKHSILSTPDYSHSTAPPIYNPTTAPPEKKPKKLPLRDREPVNGMEKVEKVYFKNWDDLYHHRLVKTADPVVNWNQTRKLLKKHFEKLSPDQIIQAINNGMNDNFIMSGGYSLATMLSTTVLNRLINSSNGVKHGIAADNIPPDKAAEYFREE